MLRLKISVLTAIMIASQWCVAPTADAGPLLDWIRSRRRCRQQCNQSFRNFNNQRTLQQTSFTGGVNPYGLQPGQCARTCNQTCSRVVVNYVPYTAYRTNWKRVPITQYRPETSSDPCTGCTVTCMKPCTTYNWQMQRVPYTTYRPVYRTENYTVPVTTITNNCATGTCSTGTCATCPTPGYSYPGATTTGTLPQSTSVITAPNGTLGTGADGIPQYNAQQPADAAPFIDPNENPQSRQRPILDYEYDRSASPEGSSTSNMPPLKAAPVATPNNIYPINEQPTPTPAVINFGNQTAMNPVRKKWSYKVQLASYTTTAKPEPVARSQPKPVSIQGTFVPSKSVTVKSSPSKAKATRPNSAWKSADW